MICHRDTESQSHREKILELKAVDRTDPVFLAQLLSYLRLTNTKLGLLINFNAPLLKQGVQRIIL